MRMDIHNYIGRAVRRFIDSLTHFQASIFTLPSTLTCLFIYFFPSHFIVFTHANTYTNVDMPVIRNVDKISLFMIPTLLTSYSTRASQNAGTRDLMPLKTLLSRLFTLIHLFQFRTFDSNTRLVDYSKTHAA